jgi:Domain of unknown function (DUF1990)
VTAHSTEVPPQPGPARRAAVIAHFPVGLAVSTVRYLRSRGRIRRSEEAGDASDLPPDLAPEFVDGHLKPADDGAGPLLHRLFRIRVRDAELDAAGLMGLLVADLDQAAPSEVVSFRKQRGRLGELEVGDEYRVRMPAPWDGPVRVVDRAPTSFRFATLRGHLEAGQIEFRAHDDDRDLIFEIETWSRPGDRAAALVFDRLLVAKEIQLHMWSQFCLSVASFAGGRRDGFVTAHTRRADWPVPLPARPSPRTGR